MNSQCCRRFYRWHSQSVPSISNQRKKSLKPFWKIHYFITSDGIIARSKLLNHVHRVVKGFIIILNFFLNYYTIVLQLDDTCTLMNTCVNYILFECRLYTRITIVSHLHTLEIHNTWLCDCEILAPFHDNFLRNFLVSSKMMKHLSNYNPNHIHLQSIRGFRSSQNICLITN